MVFFWDPFQHEEGSREGTNLFHVESWDGVKVGVGFKDGGAHEGVKVERLG